MVDIHEAAEKPAPLDAQAVCLSSDEEVQLRARIDFGQLSMLLDRDPPCSKAARNRPNMSARKAKEKVVCCEMAGHMWTGGPRARTAGSGKKCWAEVGCRSSSGWQDLQELADVALQNLAPAARAARLVKVFFRSFPIPPQSSSSQQDG